MTNRFRMNSTGQNPSLCVYIGNICSIDDQTLINYCSKFGPIVSCTVSHCPSEKRPFCDFRIVEFVNHQHLKDFLQICSHQIGNVIIDVKDYDRLLQNLDLLNLDRKLFVGPINKSNDINVVLQFYRKIDSNLQHCLSRQVNQQTYLLIEFTNRQYIRTIIQQEIIPKTVDNQPLTIHSAVHPKDFIKKNVSSINCQCQISIQGLNKQITETMLTDYFDKRAPVVACHRLSNNPNCAIIEFTNQIYVKQLLDTPNLRLYGANLSLDRVAPSSVPTSSLSSTTDDHQYDNDQIDELLEATGPQSIPSNITATFHPTPILNQVVSTISQVNVTQQRSHSFVNVSSAPIAVSSSDENGWASPPATIINHYLSIDRPSQHCSPMATTNLRHTPIYRSLTINNETKFAGNRTNNILQFVEQFHNDIDQMKDEYMSKFTENRRSIEREFNQLINHERITLDKFNRYFNEHRRYSKQTGGNKRKHSQV